VKYNYGVLHDTKIILKNHCLFMIRHFSMLEQVKERKESQEQTLVKNSRSGESEK
jgi:hypothetical protein